MFIYKKREKTFEIRFFVGISYSLILDVFDFFEKLFSSFNHYYYISRMQRC